MRLYSDKSGKTLVLIADTRLGDKVKGSKSTKTRDTVQAKRLYSKFQGFKSHTTKARRYKDGKLNATGKANHIIYQSDKWRDKNTRYIHKFKSRPSIYLDNPRRPKVIIIKGTKIRVTARGIEG
jgi:hypothetical protein